MLHRKFTASNANRARGLHSHKFPPCSEKDTWFTNTIQISTVIILHLVNLGRRQGWAWQMPKRLQHEGRREIYMKSKGNHANIFSGYSCHSQAIVFLISRFKQQWKKNMTEESYEPSVNLRTVKNTVIQSILVWRLTVASKVLFRVSSSKMTQPTAQISDLKLYFTPWQSSGDM